MKRHPDHHSASPRPQEAEPDAAASVSEEAWREIEATLGLTSPDPDLRRKLEDRIIDFVEHPPLPDPRPAQVRKWLSQVRRDAQRLLDNFELPEELKGADWQRFLVLRQMPEAISERLPSILTSLIRDTERRLERTPRDKGGSPDDGFTGNAIYDLATLFSTTTGRRPTVTYDNYGREPRYGGEFFQFVDVTLRRLAPRFSKNNQALGMMIKRVLPMWGRKHPKQ
jgi:hypothetical protein